MKNILLGTLFVLITTLGFSQQTYMPDDAFEYSVEGFDFNNDNYVSTASIQVLATVWIPPAVQDLTGIEDFNNLSIIYISNSSMTTIDLSNCPNLHFTTINTVGGISVNIIDCQFLTTVILPPNEIRFYINSCPYLSEVTFQNSNIIRSPTAGSMESAIIYNPSLICIDMSNILDVVLGSGLAILGNDNLTGINLKNGKCDKWAHVSIAAEGLSNLCIQVDNPTYCYTAESVGTWERVCSANCTYSTSCPNCIAEVDVLPTISINISPNPTSSKITVKSSLALIGEEYIIYDQLGKAVKSGVITAEETEIDLSNLSEGVYLFKAGTEIQENFKIIKQ
jgi:hypothetical protein